MFKLKQYDFRRYDYFLVILVIILSVSSVFFIHCVDVADGTTDNATKQIFGLVLGIFIVAIVSVIDYNFVIRFMWPMYAINLVLLILVRLIGVSSHGAKRWLNVGVQIQPSELSKIIMIICMAGLMSYFHEKINKLSSFLIISIAMGIPTFLILIQTNLSTSIVMAYIFVSMLFVAGLSYRVIAPILIILVPAVAGFFWYIQQPFQVLLKEYQLDRVIGFLNPEKYSSSIMYQQSNAVQAVGSGKLYGKIFENGVKIKGSNYVSEAHNDFIFSVIGEEAGFIGGCVIIALLAILIFKCMMIAKNAKDISGKLIATGVSSMFMIQVFVNIGVVTSILPNTGLPLPFVSYGLSSLLSSMLGIGLVLNVSLQRKRI
ncbi:FtsW/RodA/SpoVE family cell cycle protein [Anaeromicropila herbilytica]|uniref:Rod shape-determining protein RodA n=1 Tax=Anaeromicropila herbilytica TaxID=2785025 RepID=A0A7R7IDL5_9FIRM|nr:FtsW/RodA/SpoVE family cell cycle protein [Anaeromicropila herbilytica]BCN31204.1 rod shape-determining protein RodA [Anaeromicropila herbilytica]